MPMLEQGIKPTTPQTPVLRVKAEAMVDVCKDGGNNSSCSSAVRVRCFSHPQVESVSLWAGLAALGLIQVF